PLTKIVTTIGKPGICVASITRKSHGYDLAQVEGQQVARVNGVAVDAGPITLMNRDQMELGGIRLEFLER
ncbi:MAG TPA: FHA domain-containing protein, partial [Ottowia sp.]|nr:FHA domain-containing protein [Ottowia sp.]